VVTTHTISADDGTTLALHADGAGDRAVLFAHGATFGARPAFATPGYSWLSACAEAGRAAYALDARGYGDSERPAALDAAPGPEPRTTLHQGQGVSAAEPTIEAPNGTLVDLTAAARDGPVYDAGAVSVPSLVVRGSLDRTATRADGLALYDALGSDDREYAELAGGSHFLALERRRDTLFDRVRAFHDRVEKQ